MRFVGRRIRRNRARTHLLARPGPQGAPPNQPLHVQSHAEMPLCAPTHRRQGVPGNHQQHPPVLAGPSHHTMSRAAKSRRITRATCALESAQGNCNDPK